MSRQFVLAIALLGVLAFTIQPAAAQRSGGSQQGLPIVTKTVTVQFPTVTIYDVDDLTEKIGLIRSIRNEWLTIIHDQLANYAGIAVLIGILDYALEENLAQALNYMVDTGEPVMVDVSDITYLQGSSQTMAMSGGQGGGGVYGPPLPPGFRSGDNDGGAGGGSDRDCLPRDFFGPLAPGQVYCPDGSHPLDGPGYFDICEREPVMCGIFGRLTGGGLAGGYGSDGDSAYEASPWIGPIDLAGGWDVSLSGYGGDPPGPVFEGDPPGSGVGVFLTFHWTH